MERIKFDPLTAVIKTPAADEYVKDGLIYCKRCNTPRQMVSDALYGYDCVYACLCDCQARERDNEIVAEKAAELQRFKTALREQGLPNSKYWDYTFTNDDDRTPDVTRKAKRYVEIFSDTTDKGLLFYGQVGTGKTFFAVAIANALIDKGYRVICTNMIQVIREARDFRKSADAMDRYFDCAAIVIDDLGAERNTEFSLEQVYYFVDKCVANSIPLIITTNLALKDLEDASKSTSREEQNSARIYSRIMSVCYPVKVDTIRRRAEQTQSGMADFGRQLDK